MAVYATVLVYTNKNSLLYVRLKSYLHKFNINILHCDNPTNLAFALLEGRPAFVFFDENIIINNIEIINYFLKDKRNFVQNTCLICDDNNKIAGLNDRIEVVKSSELEDFILGEQFLSKIQDFNSSSVALERAVLNDVTCEILKELKFTQKHTGYFYLKEAINLFFIKNGVIRNLDKEIYPIIASKYHTTKENIEKCIRNSIKYIWFEVECDTVERTFRFQPNTINEKPSNKKFLGMLFEEINRRYKSMI